MASVNGPASAVTPAAFPVAASSAGVATAEFTVTARCAPRCAANAWSKGPLLAASSARPRVADAVDTSSTMPMTADCTLCRSMPPDAVLITLSHRVRVPRRWWS